MRKTKCILFYGTPAHGHINPTLPIITSLAQRGYNIVYYATAEFRETVERCGAEFREYDFGNIKFEPQIGSKILNLSELILRFCDEQLESLIGEAEKAEPVLILHDTIAFWGRAVSEILNIKAASVNTFITAYKYFSRTALMYTLNFSGTSLLEIGSVPNIIKYKARLKKKYGLKNTDILSLLMNGERFNIFTYPRIAHPEGYKFNDGCFFLGSSSILRKNRESAESDFPENLIYVSLGTIFNGSTDFWKNIFSSFGGTKYNVIVSCGSHAERLSEMNVHENITLKSYVNQSAVLKHSVLFISAGGINSVSEAVAAGVPCLFCPQQGEQKLASKVFEKIGLGKLLKDNDNIFEAAQYAIGNFELRDELIREFSTVYIEELAEKIDEYIKEPLIKLCPTD